MTGSLFEILNFKIIVNWCFVRQWVVSGNIFLVRISAVKNSVKESEKEGSSEVFNSQSCK